MCRPMWSSTTPCWPKWPSTEPKTLSDLRGISGVGEKKLEAYGMQILRALDEAESRIVLCGRPRPESPITYIEPLFRPPSEARSLIFQITNGCSWNKCTYCDMYTQPQKKFSLKPDADVLKPKSSGPASTCKARGVSFSPTAMPCRYRRGACCAYSN